MVIGRRASAVGLGVALLGAAFAACAGGAQDTPGGGSAGAAGEAGGGGDVGGGKGGAGSVGGGTAAGQGGGTAGSGAVGGGTGGAAAGSGGASGAGQGGNGGTAGAGGGQGGSGGVAGTLGGDGGGPTGTEAPKWEPVVNPVGKCKLDRLVNPATMRAPFKWVKCDIDIPGCLMLELDASLAGPGEMYHTFPGAFDDGEHKWILLRFAPLGAFEDTNIVARYDGLTVGGFRSRDITEATGCYSRSGSIGAGYVACPIGFPAAQIRRCSSR